MPRSISSGASEEAARTGRTRGPRSSSRRTSRNNGTKVTDLSGYDDYHSPRGDIPPNGDLNEDFIVAKVASALSDAVASLDHLKIARGALENVADDRTLHSQEMARAFHTASAEVSTALTYAPMLLTRTDLTDVFSKERFLVTADSAGKVVLVLRKSERWLRTVVRDIGGDLVAARREAAAARVRDSM